MALKADLEKELAELKKREAKRKKVLTDVLNKAIKENCTEALPYVEEISEAFDLGICRSCYMTISMEVPVKLRRLYEENEISEEDIQLTIKGKAVEIESIDDFEDN